MRATRLLALALLALAPAAGCGDDITFPDPTVVPDPQINAIIPGEGFSGRPLRVQVSGDGTEFTAAATVAFSGAGITVNNIELASPSSLFVDITIAGDAALGLRDVTVTDGAASLALTQAFDVQNALIIQPTSSLAQGGIGFFTIINLDPAHPFLGALTISGLASSGTQVVVQAQTLDTIDAAVLIDVDATPGPLLIQDVFGTSTIVGQTDLLPIQTRTATPLTAGKGAGSFANATLTDLTLLFSFTASSALHSGEGFNNDFSFAPATIVWLVNGKWAEARGFSDLSLVPTTQGQEMFVVAFDPDFILGDNYDFFIDEVEPLPAVTNLAEVEPNNATTTAQTGATQTLFTGSLTDVNDVDLIKVTVTANQVIRVFTTSGFLGAADTDIDILDSTGAVIDGSGDSDFIELGEFVETNPLTAGDFFVRIQSSTLAAPANTPYEASIVVEDGVIN